MGSFHSSCNEGPVRACSLSPSKFKMGVRDKSPTPIYSPLILIPITATIRTRQILFVITVLFLILCSCEKREEVEENKRGPVRACSLSPLKFKMGVRDKSPTPIYSPLILIPITATIRTQQILFVITVSLNIVSCEKSGMQI